MKYEIIKNKGQWYFRFKAANGEIICNSEKYKSRAKAYKAVNLMQNSGPAEVIYIDRDKAKKKK